MGINKKVLQNILRGNSDKNIKFEELRQLLRSLDFGERIKGSHHIFYREGIDDIINIQPKGSLAKPYQVKQIRNLINEYRLIGKDDDEI